MARCVAHLADARNRCGRRRRMVRRRSSSLRVSKGLRDASKWTHVGCCRVHDARLLASQALQQQSSSRGDRDALRFLRCDGGYSDAAVAGQRCSGARGRSLDSGALHRGNLLDAAPKRTPTRSTGCPGRTSCRSRLLRGMPRTRTCGDCPRWPRFAIEDWTGPGAVHDNAPSRRRAWRAVCRGKPGGLPHR